MATARLKNFDPFTAGHLQTYRLFCLHGDNDPLVRERAVTLCALFAANGAPPAVIDLDGDALARESFGLSDEIGSMSLFADRRIVRIALGARAADEAFANALPLLPKADGVLVVVDAGSDKRQEPTVRLLAGDPHALVVACPPDSVDDLADHARRTLADAGVTLDAAHARELVDLTDGDRGLLANELVKLLLLAGRGETLDITALRAAVADEAGTILEEAAERILAGDMRAALETTDRIALAGGSSDAAQLAGTALRKALWAHRNASGARAGDLRRAIGRLNDVVLASRSSDWLANSRAERTLIGTARLFRR